MSESKTEPGGGGPGGRGPVGGEAGGEQVDGGLGSGGPGGVEQGIAEPAGRVVVYTDGACVGNPGPGGWAWIVPGFKYACGCAGETTNNRMEMMAVLAAIQEFDTPISVVTDSRYISDCFQKKWWEGWVRNGWKTKAKKPVKNRDLWEPIIDAYLAGMVEFEWVRGHAGNPGNEAADRLAGIAAYDQSFRSGYGDPFDAGNADEVVFGEQ